MLNLAHNDVGNEGAEALVALVKKHKGIIQLGFHGNIASKEISNLLKNLVEANAKEGFRLAELAKNQTAAVQVQPALLFLLCGTLGQLNFECNDQRKSKYPIKHSQNAPEHHASYIQN